MQSISSIQNAQKHNITHILVITSCRAINLWDHLQMNVGNSVKFLALIVWGMFVVCLVTIKDLYLDSRFVVPMVSVATFITLCGCRRLLIKFASNEFSYEDLGDADKINQYRMELEAQSIDNSEFYTEKQLQRKYLNVQILLLTLIAMFTSWYVVAYINVPKSFVETISELLVFVLY